MPRLKPPSKEDSALLPPFAALPDQAIVVPSTSAEFAAARSVLLSQTALGFDTESKPIFHVDQIDNGPHVVQLATPDAAWILQLHLPEALALARAVIASPQICKVGFGLDNDKSTLPQRLGAPLAHVLDLDRTFKQHGYGSSTGVRAAVALVLGQCFHKSKKQSTSNWSLPQLSPAQVRYAANDAHAAAMVYAALPDWESKQPDASRPKTATTARHPAHANNTPQPHHQHHHQHHDGCCQTGTCAPLASSAPTLQPEPPIPAPAPLPARPKQIAALFRPRHTP